MFMCPCHAVVAIVIVVVAAFARAVAQWKATAVEDFKMQPKEHKTNTPDTFSSSMLIPNDDTKDTSCA